jgi:hypothetical protein
MYTQKAIRQQQRDDEFQVFLDTSDTWKEPYQGYWNGKLSEPDFVGGMKMAYDEAHRQRDVMDAAKTAMRPRRQSVTGETITYSDEEIKANG